MDTQHTVWAEFPELAYDHNRTAEKFEQVYDTAYSIGHGEGYTGGWHSGYDDGRAAGEEAIGIPVDDIAEMRDALLRLLAGESVHDVTMYLPASTLRSWGMVLS